MAWATPITHAVGDILTASDWNISSNDLSFLGGTAANQVGTTETTASTSWGNLATVGPAVTVTTGANALVLLTANTFISIAGDVAQMGVAVSGATTLAAPAGTGILTVSYTSQFTLTTQSFVASLTPGANTFTAKYQVAGGGTGSWGSRTIVVIPVP